jgi:small subunit ribosomal protein S1
VKPGDDSVQIGSTVSGWVREVDPSRKRLSLSLREVATNDPWESASSKYAIGKVVEGTVDHTGAPGVFVQLEPGLTGLIPNSELGGGEHPEGERLMVRVMSIDPSRKRISLSHEAARAAVEREEYNKVLEERGEAEGKSAMALAFERAMGKRS